LPHRELFIVLAFLASSLGLAVPVHAMWLPSALISPTAAKIKIGEAVTFTSSVSGDAPPFSYQWLLNGTIVLNATSSEWEFAPTQLQPIGNYTVYLIVEDSANNSAQSNSAVVTVAPALTVQISPLSASISVGQSIVFTAINVSGGYPPYSYEWYLNGNPVPGATLDNWVFIPATSGICYVYLRVTDTTNNTSLSQTVRIITQSIPVGGYSVSLPRGVWASQQTAYFMLAVFFGTVLSLKKRTRKLSKAKRLRMRKT
jgi:hypothetical protein